MDSILAAHPIEIYQACDQAFEGEAWLSWEPETLLFELKQNISQAAQDKLLAVQSVASSSDTVVRHAIPFEKAVLAFCNDICVMDIIQPPEIEEICYGISQMTKIIKAVHGKEQQVVWIAEIPRYVACVAKFRGWVILPRILNFAQSSLNELTGLTSRSKLRREHQQILDTVYQVFNSTSRADAREILNSPEVKALETNDAATLFVKRLLGALLFDPTLPYRTNNDQ